MARGRPFKVNWKEDEQTLYELYKKEGDCQERRRLQALWLLRKGMGLSETAEIVGVNYRTVQKWVSWYRQGGLAALRGRKRGGSGGVAARLGEEEMAKLKAKMEEGAFKTIWDARKWVGDEFEIEYSYWGMRGVFDRMGAKKKFLVPETRRLRKKSNGNGKGADYETS
jgi:transposase